MLLRKQGFIAVRQRGSHVIMQKRLIATTISVPIPQDREIRTDTLLCIIRQSELPRTLFES